MELDIALPTKATCNTWSVDDVIQEISGHFMCDTMYISIGVGRGGGQGGGGGGAGPPII